jgi:SAM-dependent methyltransferase
MKHPDGIGEMLSFRCNICGTGNVIPTSAFHRETAPCTSCGSVPRFRGVINAFSRAVYGKSYRLAEMPHDKAIRGIGMSDSDIYARGLAEKVDYTNTYYHREPRLDITDIEPAGYRNLDFIISSEVFEHVALPLVPAFHNMRAMLKRGGSLIFSVPYSSAKSTTEHFPNIHEYKLVEFTPGEWVLLNRTRSGEWEVHEHLVFHGGPGTTLEMRVFAERDLIQLILSAGFLIETIYDKPLVDIGYFWPPLHERDCDVGAPILGYVITARAI